MHRKPNRRNPYKKAEAAVRITVMEISLRNDGLFANEQSKIPSFRRISSGTGRRRRLGPKFVSLLALVGAVCAGCGSDSSKSAAQAETKPAAPAVPEKIQQAANLFLGSETEVLEFGDLAKNGKQQFLAANIVPKTPTNNMPGTVVTRAVVAEENDGKWSELLRCDEHLKNPKGYLGLTPLSGVTGWRLQYEQNADKGLQLYFTPLKVAGDTHVLPIGVRWNSETQRYQSMDRTYEHFLLESPSLENARSTLR